MSLSSLCFLRPAFKKEIPVKNIGVDGLFFLEYTIIILCTEYYISENFGFNVHDRCKMILVNKPFDKCEIVLIDICFLPDI